jgi:glycosyltransferase involved in cell wall biosynthesis
MRRKVLIWETLPIIGGGQKMSLMVADALTQDFRVEFLIPETGSLSQELDQRGIPFHTVGNSVLPIGAKNTAAVFKFVSIGLRQIWRAVTHVKKSRTDILYIPGPMALPLGAIVGRATGKPVIWHLHHMFTDKKTIKLLAYFGGWDSVKKILAVSQCVAGQITGTKTSRKTALLYNPVDYEYYASGTPNLVRNEFGIPGHATLIVHIGMIQEPKRQHLTIKALHLLVKKGLPVYGLIVGAVRPETAEYRKHLLELVESLQLKERVFLTGQRKDVRNILADADLVVVNSTEGCPLTCLEAFSAGVPVVAVNQGGAAEIVKKGKAGLIFDIHQGANGLAAAIERLTDSPVYGVYSGWGREFAHNCDLAVYRKNIAAVVTEIIENK